MKFREKKKQKKFPETIFYDMNNTNEKKNLNQTVDEREYEENPL